jgi:uncharacterized membrane protein YgaE (UPF0421/DUF939 family)
MFEPHREALRQIFKLPRPTVRETVIFSALYIAQAIICILALKALYACVGWPGVLWAMISAVLALQPGTAQSLATSIVRILANTVGAVVGYGVGRYLGDGLWQLLAALTLVVIVCESLRLDPALRTACVAVIIVLTANAGHVLTSSFERFYAVLLGCGMAMVVQIITDVLRYLLFKKSLPAAAELATAGIEKGKDPVATGASGHE